MENSVCPVCNGLTSLYSYCPSCRTELTDNGRYIDFFDDYSPYGPIDDIKMTDGINEDVQNHYCPHQVTCSHCDYIGIKLISEI